MKDEYSIDYSIPENEVSFLKGMIREYYKPEIERLNNIINELEKYIRTKVSYIDFVVDPILDKLQELKGEDKE